MGTTPPLPLCTFYCRNFPPLAGILGCRWIVFCFVLFFSCLVSRVEGSLFSLIAIVKFDVDEAVLSRYCRDCHLRKLSKKPSVMLTPCFNHGCPTCCDDGERQGSLPWTIRLFYHLCHIEPAFQKKKKTTLNVSTFLFPEHV